MYPLGLWDGALTLTHNGDDRTLYKIDAESGAALKQVSLDFMGYFTGEHLWAIDKERKRICVMERKNMIDIAVDRV